MSKKLTSITWAELKKEMSIAGDPDAVVEVADDIVSLILGRINPQNIPSLINIQLALQKIMAEFRLYEKIQRDRQHPKIGK